MVCNVKVNMKETEKIIDQTSDLLRRKTIDGYEIFLEESSHFEVESKEGKVDTLQASQPWGMALRILHQGRTGFSYTTSSSVFSSGSAVKGLERIVEDAMASAEVTSPDPCFDFAHALRELPPVLPIVDETLAGVSEKRKIENARLLEEAARSVDTGRIKKVRKASYQESISRATLINSNGLRFSYDVTFASVSVMAIAEESGESEMGWDFDFSHFIDKIDANKVGREAGRRALERLGGKRIASGVYPVLLENHIASEFLSLLAHSFLSEQVQKGKSVLHGKKGVNFFSPHLSIIDDGLMTEGAAASPVDGEGTPSQRTPLVVKGVVRGYLYDRFWANRENICSGASGVGSTGNSRRHSIKSPPGLGTSNFFIEPGKVSFASLINNLEQGVMIQEVMGLHTVDPISGDFSLGCSGQWIEKGERVHPVKSIAIAGNLYQLFQKAAEVGDDLRFFGKIGSPSLLIDGLEVSGN
ncbi:MAG: TldD/PmbA family protein [Deltaproteobacteria bacterium]|nr:TldD/PmbA family protein [Deltaproteobacteria bacterium]